MSDPRYILAKYVPDMSRMEPRNIGLFLWHKGRMLARFLDANDAAFVADKKAYKRWVKYWMELLEGDQVAVPGAKAVPKKDEECLKALLRAQEGEYMLVDAGFVPSRLSVRDIPKAAAFLFGELVSPKHATEKQPASRTLKERSYRILERTKVVERDDFRQKYPLKCPVYGVLRHFRFDYGVGNGSPLAIFHRVALSREVSINSAALMFHAITDNAVIEKDRCVAMVQGSDVNGEVAEEGRDLLNRLCRVVDVEDESSAADAISSVVPLEQTAKAITG